MCLLVEERGGQEMLLFLSLSKSVLWDQRDQESGEEAAELAARREAAGCGGWGRGRMPSTETLSGTQRAKLQTEYFNIKVKTRPKRSPVFL